MDQSQSENEIDYVFKFILLGRSSVGKSQILLRFTKNQYNPSYFSTVAVEFLTNCLKIDNKKLRIQVFDTAGQEKYRPISKLYYKGVSGAFLVYDITQKQTFLEMDSWLQELQQFSGQYKQVIMLIGNKNDLEANREVSKEEAINYATSKKIGFIETSALTGHNIEYAFQQMAKEILREINETLKDDNLKQTTAQQNASAQMQADRQVKKKNINSYEGCF